MDAAPGAKALFYAGGFSIRGRGMALPGTVHYEVRDRVALLKAVEEVAGSGDLVPDLV